METLSNIVAYNVRRHRIGRDYTVKYMAQKMHISASEYERIEDGTATVTIGQIEQLSDIFDVVPASFFVDKMETRLLCGLMKVLKDELKLNEPTL